MALLLVVIGSTGCASTVHGTPSAARQDSAPVAVELAPRTSVVATPDPSWNTVRSVKRAAAYDVPPTWNVQEESRIIGYNDGQGNLVASTGAATFGEGACGEHSNLALSVVRHDEGTDLAVAARYNAELWATAAYRDDAGTAPALRTSAPETITTEDGQQASVVEVEARLAAPAGTCGLTEGSVYAVAATGFTGELGPTVVLVVVADVGVPGAAPEAEIRRMLTTLRPEQ